MAHTIRTAKALALVSKALEAGIIARFVKDGEFFILQTREAAERTYTEVFDSCDFEDVASTLQGMINNTNKPAAEPVTDETDLVQELAQKLQNTIADISEVLDSGTVKASQYVVRHGGVLGLYLTPENFPAGILRANVFESFACAAIVARNIKNGADKPGEVVLYLGALQIERTEARKLLATLKTMHPLHPVFKD